MKSSLTLYSVEVEEGLGIDFFIFGKWSFRLNIQRLTIKKPID